MMLYIFTSSDQRSVQKADKVYEYVVNKANLTGISWHFFQIHARIRIDDIFIDLELSA